MATRQEAEDFFADILGTKKDTLFDTPIAKPKRMARRWKVTSISIIHQESKCKICGASHEVLNPHLLLEKTLNDYDGKPLKTIETDCPSDEDLRGLTDDLPIVHKYIKVSSGTACLSCLNRVPETFLRTAFKEQIAALKADPERNRVRMDKAAQAEAELMELLADYEMSERQFVGGAE